MGTPREDTAPKLVLTVPANRTKGRRQLRAMSCERREGKAMLAAHSHISVDEGTLLSIFPWTSLNVCIL